jgi:hypothetical protein
VLHWLWATRTQIRRLTEGLRAELTQTEPRALQRRRRFSLTSLEEHLLLVCAGQFETAVKSARQYFPQIDLPTPLKVALRDLRNVYEHWDHQRDAFRLPNVVKERSGKSFAANFPNGEPWAIDIYPGRDIVIAKVVSLRSLARELRRVEQTVLSLEEEQMDLH